MRKNKEEKDICRVNQQVWQLIAKKGMGGHEKCKKINKTSGKIQLMDRPEKKFWKKVFRMISADFNMKRD